MLAVPLGARYIPAQAVLDQFDKAQRDGPDRARSKSASGLIVPERRVATKLKLARAPVY